MGEGDGELGELGDVLKGWGRGKEGEGKGREGEVGIVVVTSGWTWIAGGQREI